MLLIGHRGCNYPGYNQNTIRAFEKVAAQGVPAIEFDVQLSSDRQLVVVHNRDLEEVSTGRGAVSDTESAVLKTLYAGDPAQGKDPIPFLPEVFDFFASLSPETRPAIHMELKGGDTGRQAAELFMEYVAAGKLELSDLVASSFNWPELMDLARVCPEAKIALLDGAIRRNRFLEKAGTAAEPYLNEIFAYGKEEYMLPRFPSLADNLRLIHKNCSDPHIGELMIQETKACLDGEYYTDGLLNTACEMKASSVNLWYRSLSPEFINKAHDRGLAVLVYTVNNPEILQTMVRFGADGVFTDNYAAAVELLSDKPE